MMVYRRKRIGDILEQAGLLSREQLEQALRHQVQSKQRLGKVLVEMGLLSEQGMVNALAEQLHVPLVDLARVKVPEEMLKILHPKFLRERLCLPVENGDNALSLAMVDPLDYVTIKDVQFLVGKAVRPMVVSVSALEGFLDGMDKHSRSVGEELKKIHTDSIEVVGDEGDEGEDILKLKQAGEAAPIVSMVNMILSEAAKLDASDIHIEPRQRDVLVRYRIDGLLRDMTALPAYVHKPIISRLKIMAKMDISVHRRPLDGSTKIRMGDRDIDLRISTLPTLYGEKMVIRLLDKSRKVMTLEDLGMLPRDLDQHRSFLNRPQGMILVTGPTGSGKTTTLYASLLYVRSEDVNIITIEDPVEYQILGINQVHVNERAGITFATGLRSLLRQDPNVIMVGEIRDRETAEIAFQAALTGHLVFSTLHTNNSVSTVTRLVDIGMEPYVVASSLVGVLAQRLVRRNCPYCLEVYEPDPLVFRALHLNNEVGKPVFYRGGGCEKCGGSGFRGRAGIYEILQLNDALRELIISRVSEKRVLDVARKEGMSMMVEDGIYKAMNRITTMEEIVRVIPPEDFVETDLGALSRRMESRWRPSYEAEGVPETSLEPGTPAEGGEAGPVDGPAPSDLS